MGRTLTTSKIPTAVCPHGTDMLTAWRRSGHRYCSSPKAHVYQQPTMGGASRCRSTSSVGVGAKWPRLTSAGGIRTMNRKPAASSCNRPGDRDRRGNSRVYNEIGFDEQCGVMDLTEFGRTVRQNAAANDHGRGRSGCTWGRSQGGLYHGAAGFLRRSSTPSRSGRYFVRHRVSDLLLMCW